VGEGASFLHKLFPLKYTKAYWFWCVIVWPVARLNVVEHLTATVCTCGFMSYEDEDRDRDQDGSKVESVHIKVHVWEGVDFVFSPSHWKAVQVLATPGTRPGRVIARPQFWVRVCGRVTVLTGFVTRHPRASVLNFCGDTGGVFAHCPVAAVLERTNVSRPRPVGIPRMYVASLGRVLATFVGSMESMSGSGDKPADLGMAWSTFQRCCRTQEHLVPVEWRGWESGGGGSGGSGRCALLSTLPATFILALDPMLLSPGLEHSECQTTVDLVGMVDLVWEGVVTPPETVPRRPASPPSRSKREMKGNPGAFTLLM